MNLGFPSPARHGDQIAYIAYRDDANIWRFGPDGNQPWITSVSADFSPDYSPDGRKIAFVSDRTGNLELWVAGADGKSPAPLTNFSNFPVGKPSWSPDSRRLAFDVRIAGRSEI